VGNRETRIVLVDTEFRTMCQGALSVSDYCWRMKTLADSLVELGEPISDRLLTINLLRGLNDRFAHLRSYLKRQRPFPSFVEVRSELLLEELSMGPVATSVAPSVLVASAPTSAPGTPLHLPQALLLPKPVEATSPTAGKERPAADPVLPTLMPLAVPLAALVASPRLHRAAGPAFTTPGPASFVCGPAQCRGTGQLAPPPTRRSWVGHQHSLQQAGLLPPGPPPTRQPGHPSPRFLLGLSSHPPRPSRNLLLVPSVRGISPLWRLLSTP
jgi:hypothetical protein